MKPLPFLILSTLLALAGGVSCSFAAETVIVNREFNNREIKARAGSMIQVELDEVGSAGYAWTVQNLDGEHFELLKTETKDTPASDGISGKPVKRMWLIRNKKAGKSELRFLCYRPWEGEKGASDSFVLRVRIIP